MGNKKVKIKYLQSHDFKVSLVMGVHGGISSNGLINANFFVDRTVIPDSQIVEIDEKGKILGQPVDEKNGDITREVLFGALLDVNSAKMIVSWLETQIKNHEGLQIK
jgi:hypothetical protein